MMTATASAPASTSLERPVNRDDAATSATRPKQNVSEAASRGRLVLEKKVIERIAAQAASESGTGQTGGVSGGLLGFGSSSDLTGRPDTTVELVGTTASIDIALTVAYPTPIRAATDQVRQQVMARVHELTGVEVTRIDITVTALHLTDPTISQAAQ